MAEWLRAWVTLATMKLRRREVMRSIPDRGTIYLFKIEPPLPENKMTGTILYIVITYYHYIVMTYALSGGA